MKRFLVVLPVLLLALSAPATAGAQTGGGIIGDIDAFWANTAAAYGYAYSSPGVVGLDVPTNSACGTIDPAWGYAVYCPADATMYYSVPWLDAVGGGTSWVTVFAHEWGHHAQFALGFGYYGESSEIQADCLAGAYASDAVARGVLDRDAFTNGLGLSAISGDTPFLPADAPAHGSGAERALAFNSGYNGGIPACGLF